MNETYVTLSGWLGGDVTMRDAGGVPVAHFRVASTPRRYVRKSDTWEDGDTQWYSVNAWRALAENCDSSLRRGDPVVLIGAQGTDAIGADEVAEWLGTISYEVVSTILPRVPREVAG